MKASVAEPDPQRRFLQVLDALTAEAPEREPWGQLLDLQERVGFVAMDDGSVAAVIWPSLRGDPLLERLRELLALDRVTPLKLVIVGGGDDMREVLTRAQPGRLSRRMVQVFHLRDDAKVWGGRGSRLDSPTGRTLEAVGQGRAGDPLSREELMLRRAKPPSAEERERAVEHRAFIERFQSSRPYLTRALVGFIGVMFVLEELWGGSELVVTLVRMGANTDASLGAEPWRLLASVSLHAGFLHVLVNGYVLYALGGFLERILGGARLAVVYAVAGLGGALASAFLSEAALSVGASGAIWGLLGAAGALAFVPGRIIPRNLVGPMRRTAAINLLINLSVSFLPQVDLWAHLGGGIVGAVLVFSGLLTRGLSESDDGERAPAKFERAWWIAAVLALGLLVAGSVVAVAKGRPWEVTRAPTLVQHALSPDLSVIAPELLQVSGPESTAEVTTWVLGDPLGDPVTVVVEVQPYEGGSLSLPEWNDASTWFPEVQTESPPGFKPLGQRKVLSEASVPAFEERFEAPNGLVLHIRYAAHRHARIITELAYWSGTPQVWVDVLDEIRVHTGPGPEHR